jgi:hypothetical protein
VVTVRVAPVSKLLTDTVAPLRAAALESTTLPEIAAATCARDGRAISAEIKKRKKKIGPRRLPGLPNDATEGRVRIGKAQRSQSSLFFIGKLTLVSGSRQNRARISAADSRRPEA